MSLTMIARRRWRHSTFVALAVVLTATATGCSSGSDKNDSAEDAPGGPQIVSMSEAAKGGVDLVTWNLTSGEPDTLDPPNAATYGGGQVVMNMCDSLMRYDAEYNMSPGLATFEQVSPTELVYTLKEGAEFWDGKPVTPEDVVYSLNRAKADSVVSAFFDAVKSIDATGANAVTVTFSTPDEKFNTEMTNIAGVIYEKGFAEAAGKDFGTAAGGVMCSGPFKLDTWESGNSITISRNDEYWDEARKPLTKQVKFTFVTDATSVSQALNSGEIDGAYELPPSAVAALKDSDEGRLYYGPSTQSAFLAVANPGGATADPKLMAALQHIVDREAVAEKVYQGAAQPLYTFLTPRTWPTDENATYESASQEYVDQRAYDLDSAQKLVDESDYDGKELVVAYQDGNASAAQVTQLIQQEAKKVGINLKLQSMGALAFQQAGYDASKREGIDFIYRTNFNSIADPLEPLLFYFVPNSFYNYSGYSDPEVTDILSQARAEFDGSTRADLVIEAQRRYEAENLVVPVVALNTVTFLNNRLAGAVTSFAYWSTPNMATIGSAN